MNFAEFMFYVFASLTLLSGLMVVLSRNPVHSVLFLIFAFINTAGLFVLMGAEYLAMVLIVVYVGAVAVLFMFVVMMLDVDFAELKAGMVENAPIGIFVAVFLIIELGMVVAVWQFPENAELAREHPYLKGAEITAATDGPNNVEALGLILYTDYVHYFQIAGMILLVAMIGAIILTFRERKGVKRQDVAAQVARKREDAAEVVKVPTGKGI
jgi:NADH-quinone oxidoreductase subunit J